MASWTELNQSLLDAVGHNSDLDQVRNLCEQQNVNVNAANYCGTTALINASFYGRLPIVQYLVETARANVDIANNCGQTALTIASENGRLAVVQYLVETGHANVEAVQVDGPSPLYDASSEGYADVVQYLVETGGASVEGSCGADALYTASLREKLVVECLVETCRVNVDAATEDGATALHIASKMGCLEVAQYLVETAQANVEAVTAHTGRTALHVARCRFMVEYLVETGHANVEAVDVNGWTVLHHACSIQNLAMVKYLIATAQSNVHALTSIAQSALHLACACSTADDRDAELDDDGREAVEEWDEVDDGHPLRLVQFLVETCGVDSRLADSSSRTALHVASEQRDLLAVLYLVQRYPVFEL